MRCLLLISLSLYLVSCTSAYKHLQVTQADPAVLNRFKPTFSVALYKATVDVVGNHLSGLLMIKKMPDSSTRLVFSNEMGFKFFDFEFSREGIFRIYSIIKQMDKKPVIKTLRKDFELILMKDLGAANPVIRSDGNLVFYTYQQATGYNHYITDLTGKKLVRLERASKRKPVMQAILQHYQQGMPDTIGITHQNFNFTIGLKRLEQ